MTVTEKKIAIKEIIIHWAEGLVFTKENVSFGSIAAANNIVKAIAKAAYQENCFDVYKMLYTIKWANNKSITKQIEITQSMHSEENVIGADMRFYVSFYSGIKPSHMSDEVYMAILMDDDITESSKQDMQHILENYCFS